MNFRKKAQYWLPVFLWVGLIFWLSTGIFSAQHTYSFFEPLIRFIAPSISQKNIVVLHTLLRKLAHMTEYFISGILLFRAVRNGSERRQEWQWAFFSLFVVAIIAAGDEFHQSFVITRTASFMDVCIDLFGGLLAQGVSVFTFKRQRQNIMV